MHPLSVRAGVEVSIIPVVPREVETAMRAAIRAKGGGSPRAKRTAWKNHRLTRNRVRAVRPVVMWGFRSSVGPHANLVGDLEALACFVGPGNSIERYQCQCSQYRDPELHVSPPALSSITYQGLSARPRRV